MMIFWIFNFLIFSRSSLSAQIPQRFFICISNAILFQNSHLRYVNLTTPQKCQAPIVKIKVISTYSYQVLFFNSWACFIWELISKGQLSRRPHNFFRDLWFHHDTIFGWGQVWKYLGSDCWSYLVEGGGGGVRDTQNVIGNVEEASWDIREENDAYLPSPAWVLRRGSEVNVRRSR